MFDKILEKIKECSRTEVGDRIHEINKESVVVKIEPMSYDGTVCISKLELICISRTYESSLLSFDRICEGLDELPDEESEVLDITLESTAIKYDTVSGMTRLHGVFKCYTEVESNGFN